MSHFNECNIIPQILPVFATWPVTPQSCVHSLLHTPHFSMHAECLVNPILPHFIAVITSTPEYGISVCLLFKIRGFYAKLPYSRAIYKQITAKFLQLASWNANGLSQHTEELKTFISVHNIDVMLISKTHFTETSQLCSPSYEPFSRNCSRWYCYKIKKLRQASSIKQL
jgi:hypothetical protein